MAAKSTFSRLAHEFGTGDEKESTASDEEQAQGKAAEAQKQDDEDKAEAKGEGAARRSRGPGKALMQVEERVVGNITGQTYRALFAAARGKTTVPLLVSSLILMSASQGELLLGPSRERD